MTKLRVSSRNALFQQWLALKTNRSKRHRLGSFLVEGTSAIDAAVQNRWQIEDLLYPAGQRLSSWAAGHLGSGVAERHVEIEPELLGELSERHEGTELLAVARRQEAQLGQLELVQPWLVLVLDRPKSAGNVGSIIRTALSFDAAALVITGHAADPFDPACVRASVGTLFSLPLVLLPSHQPLLAWVAEQRTRGPLTLVGTGQDGPALIGEADLGQNLVLVLGNESHGISRAYIDASDRFVRLPTSARQSSLNVCAAAAILLYEAQRQRLERRSATSPAERQMVLAGDSGSGA